MGVFRHVLLDALEVILKYAKSASEAKLGPFRVAVDAKRHAIRQTLDGKNHGRDFHVPRVIVLDAGKSGLKIDARRGGSR